MKGVQLEKFIQFIIGHNAELIQGLVGAIVVCVVFLAYRSFLAAKSEELHPSGDAPSLGNLEETLKKLLEKANQVPAAASGGTGGADATPLLAEIAELKQNLEAKQGEIEALKSLGAPADGAAPAAAAGMSADERAALDAQLKELQAKLAEYEIISEDIADLSFYKEENAKLQKQLEGLKGGANAPAAAPAPTPAPAPAPAPAAAEPEPAAPDLSELTPAPAAPAAAETATPAQADADIMKEFEMAVEQQAATAPAPAAEAPVEVDLGTMDMDKMLAEASGLSSLPVDEATNSLEATPDADKLLAEAASMGDVKADDVKLMGDFETFVKKEKGGA